MRSFGDSVFTGRITISEADKRKSILLDVISNFENKIRPRSKADKEKKKDCMKTQLLFIKAKN